MIPLRNVTLKTIVPTRIEKFLGLNKSKVGNTELKLGEASRCENFRITQGYQLQKMEGYKKLFDFIGTGKMRGQWDGILAGTYIHLFNYAGTLYKRVNEENIIIGKLADDLTEFVYFNGKVYMLDGETFKSYDGTNLCDVEGYAPLVAINAPPTGGGTNYEQINLLTGQKRMTFSPDGTSVTFVLPEENINSIDLVEINGVATNVTKNLIKGTITFESAPEPGVGTIEVKWTKNNEENRNSIIKNRFFFIFGGDSDTRLFLYGNPDAKYREYFSGIAVTPTAEYFPANNYKDVGNREFAITGMERQYDRMLVHTENDTYYGTISQEYDALGNLITDFPLYPLNSERGNIARGQTAVLLNNPVSLCADGIYEWMASNVRDERNVRKISDRVELDFEGLDLREAVTIDWEEKNEFWISIPSKEKCWIYNYGNDTWYVRTNVKAYNFRVINGELYFGSDGTIYRFSKDLSLDNEQNVVDAIYTTGFYGFGAEWLKKNVKRIWVSIKPETKAYLALSYETDKTPDTHIGTVEYDVFDFAHVRFGAMCFKTSLTVKPFRLKLRAKKFAFFRLTLRSNDRIAKVTVLSVDLKATEGGEIK